jgi:hypothetical protein
VLLVVGLKLPGDHGSGFVEQPTGEGGIVGGDAEVLAGTAVLQEIEVGHCRYAPFMMVALAMASVVIDNQGG